MASPLAVILLNYKRPQNIGLVAAAAREALPDAPIYLRDQGDDAGFRDRDDVDWDQVIFERGPNRGAGVRVPMAAASPHERFLAIDDDTFLEPEQIASLAERLRAEPDRAHGVWGERLEADGERLTFRSGLWRFDGPVSVINQVYAFTRDQAQRAMALARRAGWPDWDAIGPVDDMLLSCASAKPPLCHDLGEVALCLTADEPGVAVWRTGDFDARRAEAADRLHAIDAITVFEPASRAA